ncbi:FAD-linked oxidase C-terminal domain-containing protein [Aeromicrobium sp. UC242_57]|uniref:FAD-linked oxidase C-terminal domain-containing protein n=1 Tax=Aeromicrobium sp. UC242_57 TaxID=3374624 RepID=UPI0037B03C13
MATCIRSSQSTVPTANLCRLSWSRPLIASSPWLSLGGTLTGEHGVGTLKQAWVARQVGPDVDALHHAIKSLLDPAGILNPGKAI